MRTLRTLFWVVLTALLVGFIAMNWEKAPVRIWPVEGGYLHFDWPVGVIALVFFLLGLTPMWVLHKASRWSMRRRLDSAERALASVKPVPPVTTPSTTQDFSSSQSEL